MANIVIEGRGSVDVSLDGVADFDWTADLTYTAPLGTKVKSIRFNPAATDDEVVVRDGENGPRIFQSNPAVDAHDVMIEYYGSADGKDFGKKVSPYIHASECTIGSINTAYVYFDLGG